MKTLEAFIAEESERKEKQAQARKANIAAMPRVKFYWGPYWEYGSQNIIGVYWGKNPNAEEGEYVYLKWITIRWSFHFDVGVK